METSPRTVNYQERISKWSIETITESDLPQEAKDFFDQRYARYKYQEATLLGVYKIIRPGLGVIFVESRLNKYFPSNYILPPEYGITSIDTNLIEFKNTSIVGNAEIREFKIDISKTVRVNSPLIAWTETEKGWQRQGLAEDRLLAMGKFSKEILGTNLRSGSPSNEQVKIWEKFTKVGIAKIVSEKRGDKVQEDYIFCF